MLTIDIPAINYSVAFPEAMHELTNAQLQLFAGLLMQHKAGDISLHDLETAMVLKILNVNNGYNNYQRLNKEAKLAVSENVNQLTSMLGFLFERENDTITPNRNFTQNFVPHFNATNVRTFYGPANALSDCTFLEYKDAGTHFRQYAKTEDEADLNRLVAVLYRPKDWRGNRVKYNPDSVDKRAALVSKVPIGLRFGVFLFFGAIEHFLKTATLTIDNEEISLHILYETTLIEKQKSKTPRYANNTGLAGVALSLASTGIFGPIDKVYNQNLYDVLLLLYKQRIEYLNQLEN